jgi:hypothetical protein
MTLSVAVVANRVSRIELFSIWRCCIIQNMKARELTLKQILAVRCPTCGAAPQERCELTSGQSRTEPHRDRRLTAADDLDT